jgi:predicted  nucleic acid-binding Zn-ribbon protein
LRKLVSDREQAVKDIQALQETTRTSLAADQKALEKELSQVRAVRETKSGSVPRSLLQRYDRIRAKRRSTAVYPLRGQSCAHCDTAIPVVGHSTMVSTGQTEQCEGCGVLLYAADT